MRDHVQCLVRRPRPEFARDRIVHCGFHLLFYPPTRSFEVVPADLPRVVLLAVTGLFVVWLNVARREAEAALRRSEGYLADAQRLSHTGSFGWNVASGDIVWSKETYRIFGMDKTVTPTLDLILQRVHPDDRELVLHEIDRAARGEPDDDYEHRLVMPDGAVKHLTVRTHRAKYESGEEELVGALMDVTATRETQEALHTAQAELARVARVTALGQMSASIAHEVNQPLASISTTAVAGLRWLTRDVPEVDEARACLNYIVEEANRAAGVIRSVRDLARRADPELIPLDINEVIGEAVALDGATTACVGIAPGAGRPGPAAAGDHQSCNEWCPGHGERHRSRACANHPYRTARIRRGARGRTGRRHRHGARGAGPAFQRVLHDEARWNGYGTVHLSFDR